MGGGGGEGGNGVRLIPLSTFFFFFFSFSQAAPFFGYYATPAIRGRPDLPPSPSPKKSFHPGAVAVPDFEWLIFRVLGLLWGGV